MPAEAGSRIGSTFSARPIGPDAAMLELLLGASSGFRPRYGHPIGGSLGDTLRFTMDAGRWRARDLDEPQHRAAVHGPNAVPTLAPAPAAAPRQRGGRWVAMAHNEMPELHASMVRIVEAESAFRFPLPFPTRSSAGQGERSPGCSAES
jgi:hypothetical protein